MIGSLLVNLFILVFLSFAQIRPLLRKGLRKEAIISGGLMGLVLVISSLLLAGVNIPSFITPYKMVIQPIGEMLLKK